MCSSSSVLLNVSSIILTASTKQVESRYKLPGPAVWKGTRGPTMFDMFLSFLVPHYLLLYKFTPSDQEQVSLQLTVTLIDSEHNILADPPLMTGQKTFFSAGLEPAFGVPAS